MEHIEDALRSGSVTWEGLVRNVEYLGLREDVKRYLGKWWKNWRESDSRTRGTGAEDDDDDTGGYHYPTGMDMDDDGHAWSSASSSGVPSTAPSSVSSLDDEMAGLLGKF